MDAEVVVVGGGIAGSALATVLARQGREVVVLERQRRYADRVRGEYLVPWGVAEAQRLGVYDVLIEAGGHHTEAFIDYGDGTGEDVEPFPYAGLVDGVPGAMGIGHPAACAALAAAAAAAGATVVAGVTHVDVTPCAQPSVTYRADDVDRSLACGLVVGADGRSSRVRRQAGITLERAPETHMVTGLLVADLDVDPGRDVAALGDDLMMITFPQGGGKARVYLTPGTDEPQRFAGRGGEERFLRAAAVKSVPDGERWAQATPAGPVRTYPGDDTWTDRPFTDGVVLIGDAGGHNNPLIGQGLSLALRDVRALSETLLDVASIDDARFERYGQERAERLRRMRFVSQLEAVAYTTFGAEGRALRAGIAQRQQEDPSLAAPLLAQFTGPDALPPDACTEVFRRRYFGLAA